MPSIVLPFGKMDLEQGSNSGANLWAAVNATAQKGGYAALSGWYQHDRETVANFKYGAGIFKSNSKVYSYLPSDTTIYRYDFSSIANFGRPAPGPGPGGANYATSTSAHGWFFTQFGPYILATNGVDYIQIATPESATPANQYFNNMSTVSPITNGADPVARFICTHKNHVIIANITMYATYGAISGSVGGDQHPYLVWWSGLDSGTAFGDLTNSPNIDGTGWQQIYDGDGPITGIVGGYDAAFIFKSGSIHRMDGPPFQINCISGSIGCAEPRSIIRQGDRVYFWSTSGPAYIDTTNNSITLLDEGASILTKSAMSLAQASFPVYLGTTEVVSVPPENEITAIGSSRDRLVSFFYTSTNPPDTPRGPQVVSAKVLVYNERTEALSFVEPPWSFRHCIPLNIYNPESDAELPGTIRDIVVFENSEDTEVLVYFPTSWESTAKSHFRFPFLPFTDRPGQRTRITRIRPIFRRGEGFAGSAVGPVNCGYSVYSTDNHGKAWLGFYSSGLPVKKTESSAPILSQDGWVSVVDCPAALWHSLEVVLWSPSGGAGPTAYTGDYLDSMYGVEIEFVKEGLRGA